MFHPRWVSNALLLVLESDSMHSTGSFFWLEGQRYSRGQVAPGRLRAHFEVSEANHRYQWPEEELDCSWQHGLLRAESFQSVW